MDFSQGNNFPIGNSSEVQLSRNGNQRHGTNYQTVWTSEDGMWNREASIDANIGPNQAGMQPQSGNEPPNKQFRNFSSGTLTSSESAKVLARTFYKTRLCRRFQYSGTCAYDRCNFAHGLEELRKPPPNWEETLAKYKEEHGASEPDLEGRGSSAICLVSSDGYGNHRSNSSMNPSTCKTNICFKWNMSGNCSYGNNCQFAHGAAELRPQGAVFVGENVYGHDSKRGGGSATSSVIAASAPGSSARQSVGNHRVTPVTRLTNMMQGTGERMVRWKGPNKISKIYGDWIDDL